MVLQTNTMHELKRIISGVRSENFIFILISSTAFINSKGSVTNLFHPCSCFNNLKLIVTNDSWTIKTQHRADLMHIF